MTWMLLKDWIPTKTRSIMPLTAWPLLCRISPPGFTSHVFPCCRDVPVFWGGSWSPLSWPEPRASPPCIAEWRDALSPRKCLTLTRQPVASQRDFVSVPQLQLFVPSRIHYCKPLTFVVVLCWGRESKKGNLIFFPPRSAGTLWTPVLLDLLMRESFMYGGKLIPF